MRPRGPVVGDEPDGVVVLVGLAASPAVHEVSDRRHARHPHLDASLIVEVVAMPGELLRIANPFDGADDGGRLTVEHPHGVHPASVVPRVRERDLADDPPPAALRLGPLEQEELAVAPADPEVAVLGHRHLAAAVLAAKGATRGAREDADRLRAVVDTSDGRDRDLEPIVLRALEEEAQNRRLEVGGDEDLVLAFPERPGRAAEGLGAAELELEDPLELVRWNHERISLLVAGRLPAFVLPRHGHGVPPRYLPQAQRLWISIGEV